MFAIIYSILSTASFIYSVYLLDGGEETRAVYFLIIAIMYYFFMKDQD
jgi:hypothetical protein